MGNTVHSTTNCLRKIISNLRTNNQLTQTEIVKLCGNGFDAVKDGIAFLCWCNIIEKVNGLGRRREIKFYRMKFQNKIKVIEYLKR
jgi:hypothetical protein